MSDLHPLIIVLGSLPSIALFVYMVHRYAVVRRTRPEIAKADIIYQESFASGASQRNVFTKLGGARNCLRLVVTRDLLWITSWPFFSIFAALYDLAHVIPLRSIGSVVPSRFFGSDTLLLSYTDGAGSSHTLRLIPRQRERFLEAIGWGAASSQPDAA